MKVNLALHILHFVLYSMSIHSAGEVGLSEFREQLGVPAPTFYRHVKNLRDAGFIFRVGRDRYKINASMFAHMRNIVEERQREAAMNNVNWSDDIPF